MFRRGFVTVSRGNRSIEWSKLLGLATSAEKKQEFARLRSEYENVSASVLKAKKSVSSINWDHYSSVINAPGVADLLKKEFEGLTYDLPVPPVDTTAYDKAVEEAVQVQQNAAKNVTELEERLEFLQSRRVTKETTVNEFLSWYPEIAAEIEEDHKNGELYKSVL